MSNYTCRNKIPACNIKNVIKNRFIQVKIFRANDRHLDRLSKSKSLPSNMDASSSCIDKSSSLPLRILSESKDNTNYYYNYNTYAADDIFGK